MTLEPSTGPSQCSISRLGLRRDDRWLVRRLDLEIRRGTFLAVTGPSGVGKSSLLEALSGGLEPAEGEVTFRCAAKRLHRVREYRNHTGVIFQNFILSQNELVLTNVLAGRLSRHPWWRTMFSFPKQDKSDAWKQLGYLGLWHKAHHRVCELSGGEQQRTAIARALHQEPELILADEPVSQLDPELTMHVMNILREQTTRGSTVVCVIHNRELALEFSDMILELSPQHPNGWKLLPARSSLMEIGGCDA